MVRTSRPLVERMALIWHDWFATSNDGVGSQRLMLKQNELFRERGLGSFHDLLLDVTRDPAMLLWLNGGDNSKDSPNENYGREMMELFTLGHGSGYTEDDVRAAGARAHRLPLRLEAERRRRRLPLRPEVPRHGDQDDLRQTRRAGRGATRAGSASRTPRTRPFFVQKLWSYFVPVPPDAATRERAAAALRPGELRDPPVVAAILKHPALYDGPAAR